MSDTADRAPRSTSADAKTNDGLALNAERNARLEAIFNFAMDCPPGERVGYIKQVCGEDVALCERVQRLLTAHHLAGTVFEDFSSAEREWQFARLKPEEAGDLIGPYRLIEQIGEGGFGVVWMAEQQHPVKRRVALKIIKLGMDTKDVLARFDQERQALALMDHPNIAKVFDAGSTQHGRPYFAMELVQGLKITEYCDKATVDLPGRLALFMEVCRSVQHAHQKGIIHRDLKPSNILVTLQDGKAVPKVIDFGVAKAVQQRLTDLTIFTEAEQLIGTPLYMSPEQADMSGLHVDTRTDIYALGVLLYELLTGRTPFDRVSLLAMAYDEMRRTIREAQPAMPSAAVRAMAKEEFARIASFRRLDPGKLVHLIKGDLDCIVMKCLEKDRSRRYETANALLLDVERSIAASRFARGPRVGCIN